jgi:hypothetical protein
MEFIYIQRSGERLLEAGALWPVTTHKIAISSKTVFPIPVILQNVTDNMPPNKTVYVVTSRYKSGLHCCPVFSNQQWCTEQQSISFPTNAFKVNHDKIWAMSLRLFSFTYIQRNLDEFHASCDLENYTLGLLLYKVQNLRTGAAVFTYPFMCMFITACCSDCNGILGQWFNILKQGMKCGRSSCVCARVRG